MRRIALLAWLIMAVSSARAADNAVAPEPNPGGTTLPVAGGAQPVAQDCPQRPPGAEGAPSSIVVALDPDTWWRPRGAEVRFTISRPGGPVEVTRVRVCFGWSSPDPAFRASQGLMGSPQVRSVDNATGVVEYGALVPELPHVRADEWWPRRLFSDSHYTFTGGFSVPVADMVVEVTTPQGPAVVTVTQVGVTSVTFAWVVVAGVLASIWLITDRITRHRGIRGSNLLLRVIATQDGYASLSQLQIVLWTMVVALSAIYVMTLSGNLISISEGTLVLLGIASGSALAARMPAISGGTATPKAADAPPTMPEWSDLIIPDRSKRDIDVTRVQMLAFTLIIAAFVLINVMVDYEIPAIPANFLVLMGISNGVYVGGLRLPSQPKNGGAAVGGDDGK